MDSQKLLTTFDRVAPVFADQVGGPVHLVRVIGARWSYVAGHVPDELPFVEPQKVMLDREWAIMYYPQAGRKKDPAHVRKLFLDLEGDDDETR